MLNKLIFSGVLPLGLIAPVVAGQTSGDMTDPVAILKKADQATKAVKSARYHLELTGTGAFAERLGNLTGDYLVSGFEGMGPKKFYADVQITKPGSSEKTHLTIGGDGENYFLIDHAKKIAYQDIDPAVIGRRGQRVMGAAVIELVHPTPFSDEINGAKHELIGSKTVAGEPCYEVRVVYREGGPEAVWCFSKKDFLPRARTDVFKLPTGEQAGQQRTISKLQADPKVADDAYRLKLPDGYKQTDDFAP